MAQVVYSPAAWADLERLAEFLLQDDAAAALATYGLVTGAIAVLVHHPLIGRPAPGDLRELVISRGRSGYLALYSYYEESDCAVVLAIRHQREAGYTE